MSQAAMSHRMSGAEADEQRAYALAARARKKAEAETIGIDADYIASFVDQFYGKIRKDELLGPIFNERIADWGEHLGRMKRFWRSVLHNSGEFSGNPMIKHIVIPGLEERHFAHGLGLFYETLRELQPTDKIGSPPGSNRLPTAVERQIAVEVDCELGVAIPFNRRLGSIIARQQKIEVRILPGRRGGQEQIVPGGLMSGRL